MKIHPFPAAFFLTLALGACASDGAGSEKSTSTGGLGCPDVGDAALAAWKAGGFAAEGGSGQTRVANFEDLNGDGKAEFFVEVVDASDADEYGNLYLTLFASGDRCPEIAGTFLAQKMVRGEDGSIIEVQSRMSEDGCVSRAGVVNHYRFEAGKAEKGESKKCPCPDAVNSYETPTECQHLTY
jgi:hypothetical protein